jgi:hypothetical protein
MKLETYLVFYSAPKGDFVIEVPAHSEAEATHDANLLVNVPGAVWQFTDSADFFYGFNDPDDEDFGMDCDGWNKELLDYENLGLHDAHVLARLDMRNAESEEIPF